MGERERTRERLMVFYLDLLHVLIPAGSCVDIDDEIFPQYPGINVHFRLWIQFSKFYNLVMYYQMYEYMYIHFT